MSIDPQDYLARAKINSSLVAMISDVYAQGVSDGYEQGVRKAVPDALLQKFRLIEAQFRESGDHETAGVVSALIREIRMQMNVSHEAALSDDEAKAIYKRVTGAKNGEE